MPIRDRIVWGDKNPFSDPRLKDLEVYVKSLRRGQLPAGVRGGGIYENWSGDFPVRERGYYREYDLPNSPGFRTALRLVLGQRGEVYITGNHYNDFRQVVEMPT